MFESFQSSWWQGRVDQEESTPAPRWHEVVVDFAQAPTSLGGASVLLGFACDEGVRRNSGRVGAAEGPNALRSAMANLSWQALSFLSDSGPESFYDAGTVVCEGEAMEQAQEQYAQKIEGIIGAGGLAIGLGGGHEIAWASYLGLESALRKQDKPLDNIAIINIDAHLDLRSSSPRGSSGTPFRQIAEHRKANGLEFHYACLGVNPGANTRALFDFAAETDVFWRADVDCTELDLPAVELAVKDFLQGREYLYLTLCLDAISAAFAPGVSAPSALGVSPNFVLRLLHLVQGLCEEMSVELVVFDVAEMNPSYDRDSITAKLAARMIQTVVE